jgi:hypothetical protein
MINDALSSKISGPSLAFMLESQDQAENLEISSYIDKAEFG